MSGKYYSSFWTPDVFTESVANNYFKCRRRCVVFSKKWSLTRFSLLSLLFAVSRTATAGRLQPPGCLPAGRSDTEPSPDPGFCCSLNHTTSSLTDGLGGMLHPPAKCGQCFGCCCKVFVPNYWTGSELVFIIFQGGKKKKVWLVRNCWIESCICTLLNVNAPCSLHCCCPAWPEPPPPDTPLICKCRTACMTMQRRHGEMQPTLLHFGSVQSAQMCFEYSCENLKIQ